jgi:hypothetical protein
VAQRLHEAICLWLSNLPAPLLAVTVPTVSSALHVAPTVDITAFLLLMSMLCCCCCCCCCFQAILQDPGDSTQLRLLYANKSPDDILLRQQLDDLAQASGGRFKVRSKAVSAAAVLDVRNCIAVHHVQPVHSPTSTLCHARQ